MQYSEIRHKIKSGDILAWTHSKWGSWRDFKIQMVRLFTQSEYSHVGTAWVIGDRVFVIEAVVPLVRIYPLSKLGEFYLIPTKSNWSESTEAIALSKIGERYSQIDAMLSLFKELRADARWECAELVATIARNDGIELGTRYTPTAVIRAAQQIGFETYLVQNNGM
jgi:hypothetical protein